MNFRLTTVLWLFALLAAGMGTFGAVGGLLASAFVLVFWNLKLRASAVAVLAFVLSVVLLLLLLPAVQSAHEAARRNQCLRQMKQLVLAMHNYHDTHGSFPPAYSVDENGSPLHSWRVLLLPYLGEKPLYDKIRLDEPWDSEYNRQFAELELGFFRCPGCEACARRRGVPWELPGKGCTNYFVVVDPETVFQPGEGRSFADIRDGSSNTLLVVEAADRSVNWMTPEDLSMDDAVQLLTDPSSLRHVVCSDALFVTNYWLGGGNVGFGDGRARFIGAIPETLARATLTRSGGETIDRDAEGVFPHTAHFYTIIRWGHLFSFALFIALALAPAFCKKRLPDPPA